MIKIAIIETDLSISSVFEECIHMFYSDSMLTVDIDLFECLDTWIQNVQNGYEEEYYDYLIVDYSIIVGNLNDIFWDQRMKMCPEIILISDSMLAVDLYLQIRPAYIVQKPVKSEDILRAIAYVNNSGDEYYPYFVFSFRKRENRLRIKDILFFESRGRKILIHVTNGEIYSYNDRLDEVQKKLILLDQFFLRIHQSYLVNLRYVVCFNNSEIVLENKIRLQISKRRKEQCVKREYLKEA